MDTNKSDCLPEKCSLSSHLACRKKQPFNITALHVVASQANYTKFERKSKHFLNHEPALYAT